FLVYKGLQIIFFKRKCFRKVSAGKICSSNRINSTIDQPFFLVFFFFKRKNTAGGIGKNGAIPVKIVHLFQSKCCLCIFLSMKKQKFPQVYIKKSITIQNDDVFFSGFLQSQTDTSSCS